MDKLILKYNNIKEYESDKLMFERSDGWFVIVKDDYEMTLTVTNDRVQKTLDVTNKMWQ